MRRRLGGCRGRLGREGNRGLEMGWLGRGFGAVRKEILAEAVTIVFYMDIASR